MNILNEEQNLGSLITQDELFEMTNLIPEYTGLDVTIWISPKMSNHDPRIMVQSNYSNKLTPQELFVVTIENEPKVIGNTGNLKSDDINRIIDFVKLNKIVLMDYWNGNELDIINIIQNIIKI